MSIPWWGYVILAGLSWGMYVPIIFFGGQVLSPLNPVTGMPAGIGGRLASILCVGVAYFGLAVIVPLVLMGTLNDAKPEWKTSGLVFSGLAGIMGAIGAICVIFASKAAVDEARDEHTTREKVLVEQVEKAADPATKEAAEAALKEHRNPEFKKQYLASYRVFIAPMIFCLAPMINTLLSLVWHPDFKTGDPWIFHLELPGWKLVAGIVLVAAGVFLVLKSKEDLEAKAKPHTPAKTQPTGTG